MAFYRWQDYQCTNLGNCQKADSGEVIDLPLGAEPLCPECGKPVVPLRARDIVLVSPPSTSPARKARRRLAWLLIPAAILLLLVLAIGWLWPSRDTVQELGVGVPPQVTAQVGDTLRVPILVDPASVPGLSLAVDGRLPAGVSVDPAGRRLYGKLQDSGFFRIIITAHAPHYTSGSAEMRIVVAEKPTADRPIPPTPPPAPALSLQVSPEVQGAVGEAMDVPVTVEPATAPAPVLTTVGKLPPGVSLDADAKRLSGTPQQLGSYAVIVKATASGYIPAFAAVGFTIADAKPAASPAASPAVSNAAEKYDLILAGSSTIGSIAIDSGKGLARDLVDEWCRTEWPGGTLLDDELRDAGPTEKDRLITYKLPGGELRRILIRSSNSKAAVEALKSEDPNRRADIGMSSSPRPELQDGFSNAVIALDAVAVIVHPDNPLGELTLEALANIFGPNPTMARWEDGNPIRTYGPDKNSGTAEYFRAATGIDKLLAALGRARDDAIPYTGVPEGQEGRNGYDDASSVIRKVSADRYAIGYVGHAGSLSPLVRAVPIRAGAGDPAIVPNPATIRTMDYCLTRELHFYTPASARPLAADFVRFCLSDDGQKIADDDGFVGFGAKNLLERPALSANAPRTLRNAVANSDRVVVNFRFQKGETATLEPVSAQNLKRLVPFFERPGISNRHLTIVGCADYSAGPRAANSGTPRKRAETFAALLQSAGVQNPIDQMLGVNREYVLEGNTGDPILREAQRNRSVDLYLKR